MDIRKLSNPPIHEAIIEVRFTSAVDVKKDIGLLNEAIDTNLYPVVLPIKESKTKLASSGEVIDSSSADIGFLGKNENGTRACQFLSDRVNFSHISKYVSFDLLFEDFLKVFAKYDAQFSPKTIQQISCRFINRLEIPFLGEGGTRLEDYITCLPPCPSGLKDAYSEVNSSIVLYDDELNARTLYRQLLLKVSDSSIWVGKKSIPYVLDIDVVNPEQRDTHDIDGIRQKFNELRELKNTAFFNSVTELLLKPYA